MRESISTQPAFGVRRTKTVLRMSSSALMLALIEASGDRSAAQALPNTSRYLRIQQDRAAHLLGPVS
jgi:hypothetical protein